ncbi:MAG: ZIP family metal transporter [Patescibacteria group bacterium]
MIIPVALSVVAIMCGSLIGGIFLSARLHNWLQHNLRFLITFSMGVFLVIIYQLVEEVLHESSSVSTVFLWMIAGILVVEIASRLIPDTHHHHDTLEHDHEHTHIDARRLQIGDALHNIGDGILLTTAFLVSTYVGITTALAILIHELAQETSEFFILKEAGYTSRQALIRNFFISGTIIIGVVLTFFVSAVEQFQLPLLGLAAGSFIYVVLRDLLPHTIDSVRKHDHLSIHIVSLILGIALMFTIGTFVNHGHEEPGESHYMATSFENK